MVNIWKPDRNRCPNTTNGLLNNMPNANLDEGDADLDPPLGYQPLPSNPIILDETSAVLDSYYLESSEEEQNSEDDSSQQNDVNSESNDEDDFTLFPSNGEYTSTERVDIDVNYDEVRTIMSNIILPPESFPTWAEHIPETQWTSQLRERLDRLNQKNINSN